MTGSGWSFLVSRGRSLRWRLLLRQLRVGRLDPPALAEVALAVLWAGRLGLPSTARQRQTARAWLARAAQRDRAVALPGVTRWTLR